MIVYIILLVLVPGMIATIQYERIIKKSLNLKEYIIYCGILTFIITLINLTVIYIRGWTDIDVSKLYLGFMIKSMLMNVLFAYVVPFILYIIQRYITGSIKSPK